MVGNDFVNSRFRRDGRGHMHSHDTWNRLVHVETDDNGPIELGEYEYYGLHWRSLTRSDTSQAPDGPDEERPLYRNAAGNSSRIGSTRMIPGTREPTRSRSCSGNTLHRCADATPGDLLMDAKVVPGNKFHVDFKSNVVIDRFTCELSAASGVKDGLVSRETIAEISEEAPHSIIIWGPLDGDGWQVDAQEFLRRLQQLVSAMNEHLEGPDSTA